MIKCIFIGTCLILLLSGCASDDHDGRYPDSRPVPPAMTPTPPPPRSTALRGEGGVLVASVGESATARP